MARSPRRRRSHGILRNIGLVIGGVILLGVAGIVAFVATFDPNTYKPRIIAAVQSATGRTLTLNGRIGLLLSLQPTLEVNEVALSNPPGFSRPKILTLQRLELRLALLPLLSRQVQIERLVLVHPDILLETNAQGRSNWQMTLPGTAGAAPAGGGASAAAPAIALSSLRIEDGTLAIRDASGTTATLGIAKLDASAASPDAPLHLTAAATYNGAPLQLTADTGPLARLQDGAGTTPWPIKLAVTVAGTKLGLDGTIAQPTQARGLALHLSAEVPDLAALAPLAGSALPPLKNIALQLSLADGGNSFAVSDLKLAMPQLDLSGAASIKRAAPPLVTADLTAKRIDLDALDAALSPATATSSSPSAPAAKGGYVIPSTKLPFGQLGLLDADLHLAVDDLTSDGVAYKAVKLHAVDKHGVLTVDPFDVDAPGGAIDAKLTVDAAPSPPQVVLTLRAPGLALQPLLKALGRPGYASGNLELRADLHGAGDSPHAIAATMDGAIGLAVAKGQIDSQVLGGLMASLLQQTQIASLANKAGMSALNCFALRLDTSKGIGTLGALKLDSSTLGLDGTGGLNFGSETLDLHLKPTVGVAGTNIAAPVVVTGTFADPSVHPDAKGLVSGNAATAAKLALGASTAGVGLIIGSAIEQKLAGDPCAAPLALARFTQPPAAAPQSGSAPASQPKTQPQSGTGGVGGALKRLFQ